MCLEFTSSVARLHPIPQICHFTAVMNSAVTTVSAQVNLSGVSKEILFRMPWCVLYTVMWPDVAGCLQHFLLTSGNIAINQTSVVPDI